MQRLWNLAQPIIIQAIEDWLNDPANQVKLSTQIQVGITQAVDQMIAPPTP